MMTADENPHVLVLAIARRIPQQPNGHVDGKVARRIAQLLGYGDAMTLGELAELNGLVARGLKLAEQKPVTPPPPVGGTPVLMRAAA
jgi:hypothetical protein